MLKKNIYISLLIIPNLMFGAWMGPAGKWTAEQVTAMMQGAGRVVNDIRNDIQRNNERKAAALQREENSLREQLNRPQISDAEKATLQRKLNNVIEKQETAYKQAQEDAAQATQLVFKAGNMTADIVKDALTAETRKNEAVAVAAVQTKLKGDADHKNLLETLKNERQNFLDKLNFLKSRKNMFTIGIGAAAVSGGFFGMKYGSQLATDMIRHYFRNPTLSTDTSLLSFSTKVQNLVLGVKKPEANLSDVVLEAKLSQQIHDIALSVKESVTNGFNLPNILFYGPAGTGKTMMAKTMARWSGLEYIYFAASDLDKFSAEEGLIKLSELFDFAKKSNNKLMIVIDEAELLFHKRDGSLSEKTQKLLTHLLTYTGTETPDYMLVLMTNLPDKLDDAVLSRLNYKIKIDAPALEQRAGIITKYVNDYLVKKPNIKESKLAQFINKLRKKKAIVPVTVEKDALTAESIMEIARKTEGFVGRDLEKMVSEMRALAAVKPNKVLTADMINNIVANKIEQNNQILHRQIK